MTECYYQIFHCSLDSLDHDLYTPLHVASEVGHTAIIVALLEEGGADINRKGGERGETALMLSVRHHDCHGNNRNFKSNRPSIPIVIMFSPQLY